MTSQLFESVLFLLSNGQFHFFLTVKMIHIKQVNLLYVDLEPLTFRGGVINLNVIRNYELVFMI